VIPRSVLANLPNLVTLARLLSVPLAVWFVLTGQWVEAFWVFVVSSLSDGVDGLLARWLDARSLLGGYLDPLADKALLVSMYLSLTQTGHLPLWLVIMVVSRDVLIVGGVLLLHTLDQAPNMTPSAISKANTVLQIFLAGVVLADVAEVAHWPAAISILVGAVAATTVASAAGYIWSWSRTAAAPGLQD
jgi:cardiolipin synthase